jgi:hypothetical protein
VKRPPRNRNTGGYRGQGGGNTRNRFNPRRSRSDRNRDH